MFAQVTKFVPGRASRASCIATAATRACARCPAEQLRAMAFAQLTWRESLRDIEASLAANASKLCHAMGFRSQSSVPRWPTPTSRATGASGRTWRPCWSTNAPAMRWTLALDNAVYALDPARSICVCPCSSGRHFVPPRPSKLHTLLDLRGAIPAFIHISDGTPHDVNVPTC